MRTALSAKVFFCCSIVTTLLLVYMSIKEYSELYGGAQAFKKVLTENTTSLITPKEDAKTALKYILQWTSPKNVPFVYMGVGQEGFVSRKCPHTNCFVTGNRNYLPNIKDFDVIAFSGPEVVRMPSSRLPGERSPRQKYAFTSIESSQYYPVCSNKLDGFFNWTWTFRLDSDVRWGYMLIKDWTNKAIGPNKVMNWMKVEDMDPVSTELKERLKSKTRAAAWFVSNCYDKGGRRKFALDLKKELENYKLDLDIYGTCGTMSCPRDKQEECNKKVQKTYYFYLSFENSFSEDYVTEKLLNALLNNAVPVVYGGANYTRFMPDGIYLNAKTLGVKKLAAKMNELILDPEQYANYFRWHKYYSYHSLHDSPETDEYCRFCTILNDEEKLKPSVIENFRDWWDNPKFC